MINNQIEETGSRKTVHKGTIYLSDRFEKVSGDYGDGTGTVVEAVGGGSGLRTGG